MLVATGVIVVVCYTMVRLLPFHNRDDSFFSAFPKFLAIVLCSFGAYVGASKRLGLPEVNPVLAKIQNLLFSRLDVRRLGR